MIEVLRIDNLTKYYKNVIGVKDLSLTLNEGEILGFIGPNGAGKSTTIRSIMNLINKNNGDVYVYGRKFNKDDISIKSIIGYLPSEINLYDDLTVKQMLDYHQKFYKKNIKERRYELVELFKLNEDKKIEDLSLGNLKKLGIILTFMHSPKIAILDEPISGLDPLAQETFYKLLLEEKSKGTSIIYSTHILNEIDKICDRVGIIKDGNLVKIETIKSLKSKNLTHVTIESKDCDKIVKDLRVKAVYINDKTIKFKNTKTCNYLIERLSLYKIDKLLIEEATLEDVFLHYYK